MFGAYYVAMRNRDEENVTWTPGHGLNLSEHNMHGSHNQNYRCLCGAECHDEEQWRIHVDRSIAWSILVDHARRTEDMKCVTCEDVRGSFADHQIKELEKEGFTVRREWNDHPEEG